MLSFILVIVYSIVLKIFMILLQFIFLDMHSFNNKIKVIISCLIFLRELKEILCLAHACKHTYYLILHVIVFIFVLILVLSLPGIWN